MLASLASSSVVVSPVRHPAIPLQIGRLEFHSPAVASFAVSPSAMTSFVGMFFLSAILLSTLSVSLGAADDVVELTDASFDPELESMDTALGT